MSEYEKQISLYRGMIDKIDFDILDLLKQRLEIAELIGQLKRRYNKNLIDLSREEALKNKLKTLAEAKNLNQDFINKLWQLIIKESIAKQQPIKL